MNSTRIFPSDPAIALPQFPGSEGHKKSSLHSVTLLTGGTGGARCSSVGVPADDSDDGGVLFVASRLFRCAGAVLSSCPQSDVTALAPNLWRDALAAMTALSSLPEASQTDGLDLLNLLAARCAPPEAAADDGGGAAATLPADVMRAAGAAAAEWACGAGSVRGALCPRVIPSATSLLGQLLGIARAAGATQ